MEGKGFTRNLMRMKGLNSIAKVLPEILWRMKDLTELQRFYQKFHGE